MKLRNLILWSPSVVLLIQVALASEVSLRVRVVDDFGNTVPHATVQLFTSAGTVRGEGFGRDLFKTTAVQSASNGIAVVRARTRMPLVSVGVLPNKQYYNTEVQDYRFNESKGGKWQPWNPTIEILLKPILDPVAGYCSTIQTHIKVPNRKAGFDLIEQDWVMPEGKGQITDVLFEVAGTWKSSREYDSTLIVTFPNAGDGIQEFKIPPPGKRSSLLSPRFAPVHGYASEVRLREARLDASKIWKNDTGRKRGYFLRIRSQMNDKGALTSALYGKIDEGFSFFGAVENSYLRITGMCLNPQPNSTNMEFDLKRNLQKPGKR